MQTETKCPNCGGNKYTAIDETTGKCQYCGSVFNIKDDRPSPSDKSQSDTPNTSPEKIYVISEGQLHNQAIPMRKGGKSKVTAGLLGILLGSFGIHKFYLGKIGMGILYIVFCWSYIPAIVGFIEGIIYLSMSDEDFDMKYNR